MVVGHTMILPNKRVSARESAQKRVLLALLFTINRVSQQHVSIRVTKNHLRRNL